MEPITGLSTAPSLAGLADNLRKATLVISWGSALRVEATSSIGQPNILYNLDFFRSGDPGWSMSRSVPQLAQISHCINREGRQDRREISSALPSNSKLNMPQISSKYSDWRVS